VSSNQQRVAMLRAEVDRRVALPAVQHATRLAEATARQQAERRAAAAVAALLAPAPGAGGDTVVRVTLVLTLKPCEGPLTSSPSCIL